METTVSTRMPRKVLESLFIAVFVVALFLPSMIMVLASKDNFVENSGQIPTPRPSWPRDARAWMELPAKFKPYFAERFGLRERLIHWNARVQLGLLGLSVSAQVLVGRDDWLYFASERSIEDYRSVDPMSAEDLKRWTDALSQWQRFHDQRGIPLIVMICPNKPTIYPEHMPSRVTRDGRASRLDQLVRHLRKKHIIQVLDLRPALIEAKNWGPLLFDRTDTHWNAYGAFIGYREMATRLAPSFPSLRIPTVDDYRIIVGQTTGGDLARLMGLPGLLEESVELRPAQAPRMRFGVSMGHTISERPGAPIPSALMFQDSFAGALFPYLGEMFERIEYVGTKSFDFELVDRLCPDVVIFEFVERSLMGWHPELSPLAMTMPPSPSSCFCRKPGASTLPACRSGG